MSEKNEELKNFAKSVRIDVLKMINKAKSGHPGGSLSCVDLLTVLYKKVLNVPVKWKNDPNFKLRDRFILSKGHASASLYSVLANLGFFDKNLLPTFRHFGSKLQGHPSTITGLEGVETSTGSLGQGFSMGVGMALGLKLDKINSKVYVLIGDGELQEGSCWEAFMNASHHKLDNIVAIIDKNCLQIDGKTCCVKNIDPLDKKLEAFGFVIVQIDGHDFDQIEDAFLKAKNAQKPFAIIANTVKGKGVSFMENQAGWHGKPLNDEELEIAIKELTNA